MAEQTPRYHMLERLGEGGFGVVYRARLEAPGGFQKQVAIKLLRQEGLPDSALARFRDEARILGLLQDRAIVRVDPPTQISGQWALVMEYVPGESCAALLERGALPARVALEIIAEIARALDAVYHQLGPDGQPLRLIHRDLKPANLQVTPTGGVKLLDFGIARAQFEQREALTTARVSGTPAYIAPERLLGVEDPGGDVYSLGVVLHELVVGSTPASAAAPTFDAEPSEVLAVDEVLELARQMRSAHVHDRPTAREVEQRCAALVTAMQGEGLRSWAARHVAHAAPGEGSAEAMTAPPIPDSRRGWGAAVVLGGLALLGAAAGTIALWPGERVQDLHIAARQPFLEMVMEHNAHLSERTHLRRPEAWDQVLYDDVVAKLASRQDEPQTWQRIDQVWETWGEVVIALREAGLPEVAAGIPWMESTYRPELQSKPSCAKGLWMFMPETAFRSGAVHGVPLIVEDCQFEDGTLWSPSALAPPKPLPYVRDGQCRIPERRGCAVDERTDTAKSTAAAIALLTPAWQDDEMRASGAVVQLTLASHFSGFDDSMFGQERTTNMRPAFRSWSEGTPDERHPLFFGAQILCERESLCDAPLRPWVYKAVAGAIATHMAAVCYYAKNYPDHPPFRAWQKYNDGYCRALRVPSRDEVATIR